MAKLKATTYRDLDALLSRRNRNEVVIGNNTVARRDGEIIEITLHGHPIVRLHWDGSVDFTLAGYGTVTTRERVNQFIGINVVHQVDYVQHLNGQPIDSTEWYTVNPNERQVLV